MATDRDAIVTGGNQRIGDRVKTNRRDASILAPLRRAGERTAVWVQDEGHEAMPDLVGTRTAAMEILRRARQQLSEFLLRHDRVFPRRRRLHLTCG